MKRRHENNWTDQNELKKAEYPGNSQIVMLTVRQIKDKKHNFLTLLYPKDDNNALSESAMRISFKICHEIAKELKTLNEEFPDPTNILHNGYDLKEYFNTLRFAKSVNQIKDVDAEKKHYQPSCTYTAEKYGIQSWEVIGILSAARGTISNFAVSVFRRFGLNINRLQELASQVLIDSLSILQNHLYNAN
ncbi:hypothetical protein ANN_22202 [Periplaneta americana]|uniref:Uncharacterized protein n=1 Tax=Periplaneta americana TaxID=6978 RepID=A0ABQ8S7T4_PERAM|nr:hypothetical protein ANN_22202 [Periplaneta americana]